MYIDIHESDKAYILGAYKTISANSAGQLTDYSKASVKSFAKYILGMTDVNPDEVQSVTPKDLLKISLGVDTLEHIVGMLSVVPLLEGLRDDNNKIIPAKFDIEKVKKAYAFCSDLNIQTHYADELLAIIEDRIDWVSARVKVLNLKSIHCKRDKKPDETEEEFTLPYMHHPDTDLEKKFIALESYPEDSLGFRFFHLYQDNHYKFPGNPESIFPEFSVPHDCIHVISGYNTTLKGETLVSTFTAGMMRDEYAIASHIFPALMVFHLGFPLYDINQGGHICDLSTDHFWEAFARGLLSTHNMFDGNWDIWENAKTPYLELRKRFNVLPLEVTDDHSGLLGY